MFQLTAEYCGQNFSGCELVDRGEQLYKFSINFQFMARLMLSAFLIGFLLFDFQFSSLCWE